jgi:glycosyltransferase involved in cell wall biosynthesis
MLPMLVRVVPPLLRESPDAAFVLIGRDSEGAREAVLLADPSIGERLFATGPLQQRDLSLHLQACDLLVQPYPDGVSGRRTSLMAALCHGAAIVGTSGHLTEEFWSGSGALELRDANGTDDIVRCASSLLENDPARAAISRRARELYEERFSVARLAALFERR